MVIAYFTIFLILIICYFGAKERGKVTIANYYIGFIGSMIGVLISEVGQYILGMGFKSIIEHAINIFFGFVGVFIAIAYAVYTKIQEETMIISASILLTVGLSYYAKEAKILIKFAVSHNQIFIQ